MHFLLDKFDFHCHVGLLEGKGRSSRIWREQTEGVKETFFNELAPRREVFLLRRRAEKPGINGIITYKYYTGSTIITLLRENINPKN